MNYWLNIIYKFLETWTWNKLWHVITLGTCFQLPRSHSKLMWVHAREFSWSECVRMNSFDVNASTWIQFLTQKEGENLHEFVLITNSPLILHPFLRARWKYFWKYESNWLEGSQKHAWKQLLIWTVSLRTNQYFNGKLFCHTMHSYDHPLCW